MALHGTDTINSRGLVGKINKETTAYEVSQDVSGILKACKEDRDQATQSYFKSGTHYKKAFTIPDIVAIDILQKYGIDVHCPMFMSNTDQIKKVYQIIRTEYPLLLCS